MRPKSLRVVGSGCLSLALSLALSLGLASPGAQAGVIAGTLALSTAMPANNSKNVSYQGANVGDSFTASQPITVTGLGLFSSAGTGFTGTDTATLFDITTGTIIAQIAFNPTLAGTKVSGTSDFIQALAQPVTLNTTDTYDIAAFYASNGSDTFYDPAHFAGSTSTPGATQDPSGILTFVGSGLYASNGTPNTIPTLSDPGPAIRFGAATFTYTAPTVADVAISEPPTKALLAFGLGTLAVLRRRASRPTKPTSLS